MPCATGCGAPATCGSFCETCAPPWHARFHTGSARYCVKTALRVDEPPVPKMPRPPRRVVVRRVFASTWQESVS